MLGKTRDEVYRFLAKRFFTTSRAQSRLLYLFYNKESHNFLTHSAEFSSQTLFSKQIKVASAVYCSLIKHAKISQSQSLLELFKQFDCLTKQQLSADMLKNSKWSQKWSGVIINKLTSVFCTNNVHILCESQLCTNNVEFERTRSTL